MSAAAKMALTTSCPYMLASLYRWKKSVLMGLSQAEQEMPPPEPEPPPPELPPRRGAMVHKSRVL